MLSSLALSVYLIIFTSKATLLSVSNSISNQNIVITLNINTASDIANITLSGPADRWFGVGFGSTTMPNTYAIITDNGQGTNEITERKLGQSSAGNILSSTINIQNDVTINNIRTITILRNRTITDSTNDYYTFPNTPSNINIIWAFSNALSTTFGYHGPFSANTHDTYTLTLTENVPSTTPATTLPQSTMSFNICNNERCKYIISITFEILYSFTDDSNVDSSGFKTTVISSIVNILNQWIPNENNIKISLTLSISTSPQINIAAIIGIEDDDIYNDIKDAHDSNDIIDSIDSNLPNDVNTVYSSSEFSVEDINSDFSMINSTVPEDNKGSKQKGLFAFIGFDFLNYRLYDWIVLCGCIIFLLLCCCSCYWCHEQRRISKIPNSELNARTGRERISIFRRENPMKKTEIKQQDSLFEYKNNQPSPDERYENEPVVQVYTSNYAASPMRHEWNNAFNAAANAKLNEDENVIGGGQRTVAASVAMSTVSFGKDLKIDNDQAKLIPEDNERDEYFDYEQEFEQDNNNAGSGGPPTVSGSMVNRMNKANNDQYEAYV